MQFFLDTGNLEEIRAGANDLSDIVRFNAAVYLDEHGKFSLVDDLSD